MEKNKKAENAPPICFDELNQKLSLSLARIDEQNTALISLAQQVKTLEAICSTLK